MTRSYWTLETCGPWKVSAELTNQHLATARRVDKHTFLEWVANLDLLDALLESFHELVIDAGLDKDCQNLVSTPKIKRGKEAYFWNQRSKSVRG